MNVLKRLCASGRFNSVSVEIVHLDPGVLPPSEVPRFTVAKHTLAFVCAPMDPQLPYGTGVYEYSNLLEPKLQTIHAVYTSLIDCIFRFEAMDILINIPEFTVYNTVDCLLRSPQYLLDCHKSLCAETRKLAAVVGLAEKLSAEAAE
ncbi:hypothetical protein AOL_s00091g30 [Orbilia oligospora ATCC 24927]|uniref:Uncharacterized protein n=1 Tax=Arthrobotrys oligospora (strain ATCC 24927 / CBS 115.81 / DSM 1491) TaxID=756982 RepID=G1XHX8_ARTOA|nr:hypothetical protein AOL_s00091g30 [Orbilia oligospora ATCC 24927]EGX47209.1 hypothetical protein AOL_s00091g30 [Orbilia oligospora ATCC 24927]